MVFMLVQVSEWDAEQVDGGAGLSGGVELLLSSRRFFLSSNATPLAEGSAKLSQQKGVHL